MNTDVIPVMQQLVSAVQTQVAAPLGVAFLALAVLNMVFGVLWNFLRHVASE